MLTRNYVCPRCCGQARPIDGRPVTQVDMDGTLLDVEAHFCYLGDMLCASGGCELAIITRCCTAWGKFKKLLPILTSKHVSLKTRGKVFDACVRSVLVYEIDTLCTKLGIQEVTVAIRTRRLRWYGHVVRATSCTNTVMGMAIPSSRGRGRPRKTWSDCVRADMKVCSLGGIDPQNREAWRSGVRRSSRLLPTPVTGTPAAVEK